MLPVIRFSIRVGMLLIVFGQDLLFDPVKAQSRFPHHDLTIGFTEQGGCNFRWNGSLVAASGLVGAGRQVLSAYVSRQGGPQNLVGLPTVRMNTGTATPYRCFSGALREVERAGFAHVRLMRPGMAEEPPALIIRLPQALDRTVAEPDVDAFRNSIIVDTDGNISWNGAEISQATLRQYLHYVNTLRPTPELWLQPDQRTPMHAVEQTVRAIRLEDVRDFVLFGTDINSGRQFVMYSQVSETPYAE